MRRARGRKRFIAVAALVGIMAIATYAFTATNTFGSAVNKAGDGAQAISGYVVSNVTYNLNTLDPTLVDSVEFDIDAPASDVRAKLTAAGTSYTSCTEDLVVDNHYTCTPTLPVALTSIDNLRVLAVQ